MLDVQKIRKDFPILQKKMRGKPLIYFDSAATTQKPKPVIDRLSRFYLEEYATVHRSIYELSVSSTEYYNASREAIRDFLHAKSVDEIVFTKGTTESINLVASCFGRAFLKKGDEILLTETEHHSNIVPWQMIAKITGAKIRVSPVNDHGELILEEFEKRLSEKTKIVAIAHIANSTGTLHPIEEVIRLAHAKGAKVLIDGAQSACHLPVDVQHLDMDFYAFSGHKIYGPTGVGVLYGKRELLNEMPPFLGGGDMIEKVTFEETTYQKPPGRFEAGTPMIAEVIGLGAAIQYIETIGREEIRDWEEKLRLYATEKIQQIPYLRIIGTAKEKGAIISFIVEGAHPLDIGTFMDLKGIALRTGHHCAQPAMERFGVPATVRASFALYNTLEEIDSFIAALKDVVKQVRS